METIYCVGALPLGGADGLDREEIGAVTVVNETGGVQPLPAGDYAIVELFGHVTLEQIRIAISTKMVDIAALFVPEVTVTVLIRHPGDDRADICITDDEFPAMQAMLDRCRSRHEVKP